MKSLQTIVISLFFLLLLTPNMFAQEETRKEKQMDTSRVEKRKEIPVKLNFEEVKKMVHSGLFLFTPEEIKSLGSPGINLMPYRSEVWIEYFDVYAYLPVIYRRHRFDYSSLNQIQSDVRFIEIEGKLDNVYIEEKEYRKIVKMKFRVSDGGKYIFNLTIYKDGYTYLQLNTPGGRMFTYTGNTEPLEPEIEENDDK